MRGILPIFLLTFGLLVRAREHHSFSPTSSSLSDAFTDSSDESAAPSSFSDSTSRLNNNNNNDWLTDDDDDDEDDVMDESRLNVQPAAKAAAAKAAAAKAAAKPKAAVVPLSTAQIESKLVYELGGFRRSFGAGPLIRSPTLDIGAKAANDAMQKKGVVKKDPNIKHGTLQCIKLTSSDKVVAECLSFWGRQMQDYDWSKPAIKENNRFFVTAVYKAATHVGVSVKKGPSGRFFSTLLLDPAPDASKLKGNVKSYTDLFTSVAGAKCSTGFTEFGGSCYKLHKDKQTWMNANAECIKESAFLPPVMSSTENEFFKKGLLKDQKGSTWLGYNDRLTESMYMSVEGSQIRFMDWVNGQPTGKNENCVGFNNDAKYGTMADYPCTTSSTYVCKKPLEGDITYLLKITIESMLWLDDLSNPGSLASQQLSKKLQQAIKEIYTKAGVKNLKVVTITSVSNGLPPQPAPAYPAYNYLGKRQVTAIKVTPAPTTPPKPKPSGGASSKPTVKPTPPPVPTTKPKKKVTVKLSLLFGPNSIPPDPTAPLQDYLRANANKLPAPLNEQIKLVSVSIAPPGSASCPPICSTSCVSSCAPSCCFRAAPAPAPYVPPQPCVPTPYNSCRPKPAPTQPAPTQPKVPAKRPAAKCSPTPTAPCPPPVPYPYPPPAFPQYPAPPCVPTAMNNFCRNLVAKPLAANRGGFFAPKPVVNPAGVTYRYPLQPAYRRIMPRLVSSRPVSRAVLPVPQAGGYRQCIPTSFSPCPQPIMMPPPPPPPQPMMIPQYPMPQVAPPCIPNISPNCPPKPPPKKPAVKAAKPAKPLSIMGCTYPPCSVMMLPPPPPPPPPPMPMPLQMPMPLPCSPTPFNSCPPLSPPKAGKTKSKSTAPKPCAPVPTPGCVPQMPMPMVVPPMPMPQMPMPVPMACGPPPANPCVKPTKPPPPKPMLIKLPAIQIQVPQQPAPPMVPPMMPPMPPCPPMCAAPTPICPPACPKPCCKRARLGRSVQPSKKE